jgi:hypothetical protein
MDRCLHTLVFGVEALGIAARPKQVLFAQNVESACSDALCDGLQQDDEAVLWGMCAGMYCSKARRVGQVGLEHSHGQLHVAPKRDFLVSFASAAHTRAQTRARTHVGPPEYGRVSARLCAAPPVWPLLRKPRGCPDAVGGYRSATASSSNPFKPLPTGHRCGASHADTR